MNRRITKTMARAASNMMKEKAYGRQIDDITTKLNVAAENLVRKYIPSPVLACVKEYPRFFDTATYVAISTSIEKNGYVTSARSITAKMSFPISFASRYIKVDRADYDALLKINNKLSSLVYLRDSFGEQVYHALVGLKTEKRVQTELPEAIKYIDFPETKELPAPIFTGLHEVIANIKDV